MVESRLKKEPRVFDIQGFSCRDWGTLRLAPPDEKTNEIVTLETESGKRCDVAGTSWGFYLGPSLNSRLKDEGFRAALMLNPKDQLYLVAVDREKMGEFRNYLEANGSKVVCWLDDWLDRRPGDSGD